MQSVYRKMGCPITNQSVYEWQLCSWYVLIFILYYHCLSRRKAHFIRIIPFQIISKQKPLDTACKMKVHKRFRRRPGRLLNLLCTFNLRPVSRRNILKYLASFLDSKHRISHWRCSTKKAALKILQYSQGNVRVGVSYFEEYLRTAASINGMISQSFNYFI